MCFAEDDVSTNLPLEVMITFVTAAIEAAEEAGVNIRAAEGRREKLQVRKCTSRRRVHPLAPLASLASLAALTVPVSSACQLALEEKLRTAAKSGEVETLISILRHTSDADSLMDTAQAETGHTPLMLAAINGQLEAVEKLHERTDLSQTDKDGKTALQLAKQEEQMDVVQFLELAEKVRGGQRGGQVGTGGGHTFAGPLACWRAFRFRAPSAFAPPGAVSRSEAVLAHPLLPHP